MNPKLRRRKSTGNYTYTSEYRSARSRAARRNWLLEWFWAMFKVGLTMVIFACIWCAAMATYNTIEMIGR